MKKILKTISVLLVSAFTLTGACACNNGVSDLRRRERQMRERQLEQQRLSREQEAQPGGDELDPDFSVDPEVPENGEKHADRENDPQNPIFPDHGYLPPQFGRPAKPQPAPFPIPHD